MDTFLRERATLLRRSWMALEALLTVAAFVGAYVLRGLLPFRKHPELYPLTDYAPLFLVILPLWLALFYGQRLYHTQRLASLTSQWIRLTKAHLYGGFGLAIVIFAAKLQWVSRSLVFIFLAISLLTVGIERSIVLALLHAVRRRGGNMRHALIVGTGKRAHDLVEAIAEHSESGLEVVGFIHLPNGGDPAGEIQPCPCPLLGDIGKLPQLLEEMVVDEVIFCVPASDLVSLRVAIAEAELRGINIRLVVDLVDLKLARTDIGYLNGLPILTFTTLPQRATELLLKRILDVSVAGVLLVFLSPLMAFIGLIVNASSSGPVLFRQERVGQNGRRFNLYKFRTMHAATKGITRELQSRNEMSGPVFKLRDDPRVTPVGRFLRRWTLDELPQLWNVLQGHMSLVGPRPPLPEEVKQYESWQRRRLSMKPGMTGLWQVSGRNEIDFDEWVQLDCAYIDNWSLRGDLHILARTIPAVLTGRGAH